MNMATGISSLVQRRREKLSKQEGMYLNVLALVKGDERYVFIYGDNNRVECLRKLGRFASHSELSFTWYDAAVLSQKIRQKHERIKVVREEEKINNRLESYFER